MVGTAGVGPATGAGHGAGFLRAARLTLVAGLLRAVVLALVADCFRGDGLADRVDLGFSAALGFTYTPVQSCAGWPHSGHSAPDFLICEQLQHLSSPCARFCDSPCVF